MFNPNHQSYLELILLFILSYIGWGMSSIRRFLWKSIDWEDCVDLFFSYFMALSGYYLFKLLSEYLLKMEKSRSIWSIGRIFGIAGLAVIIWEILINLPYTHFYYQQPLMETSFPEVDLPLTILVIVGLSVYFWQRDRFQTLLSVQPSPPTSPPQTYQRHFVLAKGKNNITIRENEIAGFIIQEKVVWLYTLDSQQYLTPYTLKEVEASVDPAIFFRINRQVVLAKNSIAEYEALSNQKLSVSLLPHLKIEEELVVSKYSASAFKKWLAHSA